MPGAQKSGRAVVSSVRNDDKGNLVTDVEDPQAAAIRRMRPDTGTEAEQHWPVPEPEPDAPPCLNIQRAWDEAVEGVPLTLPDGETVPDAATVEMRNADLLVRELEYHMLATTLIPNRKESNWEDTGDRALVDGAFSEGNVNSSELNRVDAAKSTDWATVDGRPEEIEGKGIGLAGTKLEPHAVESEALPGPRSEAAPNGKEVNRNESTVEALSGSNGVEENGRRTPRSVYGASLLLKLQWQNRKKQKNVPSRTYDDLALFVSDTTAQLQSALEKNPLAGQEILDNFAVELTSLLLTRYLDGMETGTSALEDRCFSLLLLCAERANPKEMHIALKEFISKIDTVYLEATSYLILQPLMILWGKVIVRIARKRRKFFVEFIKVYERLYPCAQSFETTFVPDDGSVGVERKGRISRVPDILLDFFDALIKKQMLQRETDAAIALEVDILGRTRPEGRAGLSSPGTKLNEGAAERTGEPAMRTSDETVDWVCERAVTLSQLLHVLGMLWERLSPPTGEERNVPKGQAKKRRRDKRRNGNKLPSEGREEALAKCVSMFTGLGWLNPVLVCQLTLNGLNLQPASRDVELMKAHIGEDIRSNKERKNTLYSISSVAQYLCGALREGTRLRISSSSDFAGDHDDYAVELDGTAFALLNPSYAFDLVLPFIMSVIPQGVSAVAMAGIITAKAFLDRLADNHYGSLDEVLRLRIGTGCMGRECSVLGLAYHIGKAIPGLDDPKHRRLAYEALQSLLRKCGTAHAKFVILECLFYEAGRPALAGQLMTEMKNVLQISDALSWRGGQLNAKVRGASQLRSRFAQDCFARYFIPRKELLVSMNPIATAASLLMFLVVSDRRLLNELGENFEGVQKEVKSRMRFCEEYGRLGKDCIRALAAVAEHDRRNIPSSQLAKNNSEDAMAVYVASGQTLNQCVGALSFVESALQAL